MTRKKTLLLPIFLASLLVAILAYIIIALYYRTHFYPNSYINSIDYSNQTVEAVETDIAAKLSKYTLTIHGRNDVNAIITASDIQYHYVSNGEVALLKKEQNPFLWPLSFFSKKQATMQITCDYDTALLQKAIDALPFFEDANVVEPQNASILYKEDKYIIVPEILGTLLDKNKVIDEIKTSIQASKTSLSLEEAGSYQAPTVYATNEALIAACDTLNRYTGLTITYDFGDRTEVLNHELLHTWVSVDDNYQVSLDKQKVMDYVNYLGYYYTTFSSTRAFTRHDGKSILVKGGDYGWVINRSEEADALYALILEGKNVEGREPIYSQTARSRNKNDIGNTYVEISIKKQHMWLYVENQLVLDSKIVTGNKKKHYDTPTGIYAITYKERNATLVGQDYSSPVDYWMPFYYNIGFHDAPWREKFGGKIYKTNGSHGCVNMPPKKAKKLYENIKKGTPVVIY